MIPFGNIPFGNIPIGIIPFGKFYYFCIMKSPFTFGKVATGSSFINRHAEITKLSGNFTNQVNTILISPRRWGKSSLVKKTALILSAENPEIIFCFLDLFRIRTEEEFYKRYAVEIIKATSGKVEEWIRNLKEFLGRLSPTISFGTDPINDFQVSFNLSGQETDIEEILNLPERLASQNKKQIVVCIDEFQNIGDYPESMQLQKLLRSVWQYHQNTTYCLYGSKRHMMMELFEKQSNPFYKFGETMFLQKIGKSEFSDFIIDAFEQTGKAIQEDTCDELIDWVDAHPYFVQQLAHIVWTNTQKVVSREIFEDSLNEMIDQNSILYKQIISELSNTQVNFLIALAKGEKNFNSIETLQKYELGTSGNITKIKNVLINKEIIDKENGSFDFLDPVFKKWVLRTF